MDYYKIVRKRKPRLGPSYFTTLLPANKYTISLMKHMNNICPKVSLLYTKLVDENTLLTSYSDIRTLLFRYINYYQLSYEYHIQLDDFLKYLLGDDFMWKVIRSEKIVFNESGAFLIKSNNGLINTMTNVIFKRKNRI